MIRIEHIVIVRKVICQVRPYHVFHDLSSESGIVFRTMATPFLERPTGCDCEQVVDIFLYKIVQI